MAYSIVRISTVFQNSVTFIIHSFIINDIILTAFHIIFSTWLYNYCFSVHENYTGSHCTGKCCQLYLLHKQNLIITINYSQYVVGTSYCIYYWGW